MKFHDSFLDEIRARLPVSQVISRRVQLKRRGREFVGLSPFNKEKTPSFTVNDQKGFYHCFSSGRHGDIFRFVMETEGLSFPEAVERLAGEAGVPMPAPDPQYERTVKERLGLMDALEAAAKFFEQALRSGAGRDALSYAEGRGLTRETIAEFRIGYAPGGRDALKNALLQKGFTEAQLLDAGLIIKPDDGRPTYDRFRDRLTIPILDVKSRVVAFGARALAPDAQPKYLNSPETQLFDKGSMVFNFARARQAAFDKGELIVTEGYMDVIALHQAGFENVVATLGTAFTERQMEHLWQLAPEPVICFDGDKAGAAAAERAIDRMLPNLHEGQSFRFAFLPKDTDPDDLIKSEGAAAFTSVMRSAIPLAAAFWARETEGVAIETPEQKAALERRVRTQVETIKNPAVRKHYLLMTRLRLGRLFWESDRKQQAKPAPKATATEEGVPLERLVLGLLVEYPELFERHLERVQGLQMSNVYERFKKELEGIIETTDEVQISTFYSRIDPAFFFMLRDVHGDDEPSKGLRRGHKLRQRFPILKKHPPIEFVEGCLLLFIDKLEHRAYASEMENYIAEFQDRADEAREKRLLDLIRSEESHRLAIEEQETALDEWAANIRSTFAEDDSTPMGFRRRSLQETIDRVVVDIAAIHRARQERRSGTSQVA